MSDFIEVELFDGTILEFPKGTSRDVIARVGKRMTLERQGKQSFDQWDENKQAVGRGVDAVKQGYKDVLNETWNDPKQAARGWTGLLADVATSIPGAGYGLIEGVTRGIQDRSIASGLEEFNSAIGSYMQRYSPSQFLDQEKLQKSNVYRVGGQLLEVPETLANMAGRGIGMAGDAVVTGDIMTAGQGPVARELGAAGSIAASIAGGAYVAGAGRSPGQTAPGPSNAAEAIAARQSEITTPTNLPMDVELDQGQLAFPDAPRNQFGDPRLAQMPVDENGMPFDRQLSGDFGLGDIQGDLFGSPARAADTGLEPSSNRRGSDINATVERLNSGEFSERVVTQRSPVRYRGIPGEDQGLNMNIEDGQPIKYRNVPIEIASEASQDPTLRTGLDYWESRLEDQNLIYDKAQYDQHTRRDLKEIGTLLEEINALDKERKDALVELSNPNEFSSLEGDKEFRFRQINDAKEAEIQPKVARLDEVWGKMQARMKAREDAPKTRDIFSTDPNAPRRAGALTPEKTEPFDLGTPDPDRTPFNPNKRIAKNAGKGLTLEGEEPTSSATKVNKGEDSGATGTSPLGDRVIDSFRKGDVRGALIHIAASGTAFEKKVANFLLRNVDSLGDIKLRWLQDMSPEDIGNYNRNRSYEDKITNTEAPRALYAGNVHTILLSNVPSAQASRLFLHEMIHAFTHGYVQRAIDRESGSWAQNPFAAASARRIVDLYEEVLRLHPEFKDMFYGMTDPNEFVAEAFTNERFREALSKVYISAKTGPYQKLVKSAWTQFVESVAGLLRNLGLDIDIQKKDQYNALAELLNEGSRVIEKGSKTDRTLYKETNSKKNLVFGQLESATRKGQLAQKVAEVANKFTIDRRPISQIIADSGITLDNAREKVKDITREFAVGSKFMVDRSIAVLTEEKGFVHDFVKNIVDRQQEIERKKQEGMESFSVGGDWEKNRFGFEQRVEKGGILTALKKQNISVEQAVLMKNVWLENVAGSRDLTRTDFSTEAQWKAFSAIQTNLKKMWDETNAARVKLKLQPIPYIRNYFPSQWEGDYRVFIRNKEGTLIDVRSAESRGQAKRIAAALQKEFGEDFNVTPDLATKSMKDVADLSVMDDIMRALQNYPAEYAAVQRAYARVAGKRGFGSTALQRKGVFGALGYEQGQLGLRKMQKSLETYINRQQTYIANAERQLLLNEIAAIPKGVAQHMPNAMKLMQDYLNEAKGRIETNFVDKAAGYVGELVGQGDGMVVRGIHRGSRLASFFYLATTNFLLAQPFQPLFAYPRLMKMKQQGETTMSPAVAFFGGYNNFLRAVVNKDKDLQGAFNWARKNGFIEPAIMQVMNDHMRDSAFRSNNKVGQGLDNLQTTFGLLTGWMEEWTVRAPTFFIYELALRSSIKDPIKRYEAAGNMTDYYMVHYSQEALPAIYKQTGEVIGETMKPLKTFSHNYYGQFLEYIKYAKDQGDIKSVAPLMGFVLSGMLIAGAAGSAMTQGIDLFISMFNFITEKTGLRDKDDKIPTFKDLVASTNFGDKLLNDVMTFGVPSAAMGYNISGSVQAPQLSSLMEFPAVSFWSGIGQESYNYAMKALNGTATEGDEMRLLLATTPLAFRGAIEQMYSPDGGSIIPNPRDDMRPLYRRDENEQSVAKWAGWRSTDEARYRQLVSSAKMFALSEREKRLEIMDKIYDGVRQGKPLDMKLVESYAKAGGDVGNLASNIRQRMRTQDTTWAERQFQRAPTQSSVNDRQTVQRFMESPRAP
jgi:hypothetical protein